MRPNIRDTTDPLDLSMLPPTHGMQLDYRTQPNTAEADRSTAIHQVLSTMASSVFIVLLCRTAAASLRAADSPLYGVALFFWAIAYPCIGLFAFIRYLRGIPVRSIISMLVVPPLIWLLLHLVTAGYHPVSTYLVIFIPAVLISIWTSDRILHHYATWMAANPTLDHAVRAQWHTAIQARIPKNFARWRAQVRRLCPGSHDRPSDYEAELATYPLAGLWLLAALLVSFILFLLALITPELRLFAGMLAIFALLALLLAARLLWTYYARLPPMRLALMFLVAWRALVNWLTYNAHETSAPGVFASPVGPCIRRSWIWKTTIFLLTLSILPISAYFPVVPFIVGPRAWLPEPKSSDANAAPPPPAIEEVKRTLEEPDQVYYETLADDANRSAYLSKIADERAQLARLAYDQQRREATYSALAAIPEQWILVALGGTFTLNYLSSAAFFASVVLSLTAGSLAFFFVFVFLAGPLLYLQYVAVEPPNTPRFTNGLSLWDARVERLRTSPFEVPFGEATIREADHLWLGTSTINDYPILLDRHILGEHAHILGSSGSGKTAIGLAPLIAQLTRQRDSSVIVIDLKGDPALFAGAREEAEAAGLPFKWFTTTLDHSTYVFNPMHQSLHQRLTLHQRTELLIGAFGLKYGRFYGRDYFSDVQSHLLFRALRYQPDCPSFAHLLQLLRNRQVYQGMGRRQLEDASHIIKIVDRLASFPALNACTQHGYSQAVLDHAINLDDYFQSPAVLYFFLPAALESVAVAEIARLALYAALTAAATKPSNHPHIYLFIDEFQQLVSSNLEIILRHARSMGIGVILANQTLPDLKTPDGDLVPIVFSNTRFKQIFSVNDVFQQDYLSKASGEAIYELASQFESFSEGTYSSTHTVGGGVHEQIGPRHRVNDIIDFSNHPERCLVHVNRGSGFSQFGGYSFVMACKFHIAQDEYKRREAAPWPAPNNDTIVPDVKADSTLAQSNAQADRRACAEDTFDQISLDDLSSLLDDAKKEEGLFEQPSPQKPKPKKRPKKPKKGDDQNDNNE